MTEIRTIPGFETFLQPTPFHQLQEVAREGPVIVVNISQYRSDAIVILHAKAPVSVQLPHATPSALQSLAESLGPRPGEAKDSDVVGVLRELWRVIVKPVVDVLQSEAIALPLGSRIWWCLTAAASWLPIHAAGPYLLGQRDLPNLYVSSYTPTLGALIRARNNRPPSVAPGELPVVRDLLIVGQSDAPGQTALPNVTAEVNAIKARVPTATVLEGKVADRDTVLKGITNYAWVHLACHGIQNPRQPFLSHLVMHDKPLSLIDIMQQDLPHADLAVLSACHSAKVGKDLPDEVITPATGMLFAGFDSVIGTMWAMDDRVGPIFGEEFYRLMAGGKKGKAKSSKAAIALKKTVQALAEKRISLAQRVNLVHYGI